MQWELARFSNRAAENQQRDGRGVRTEHGESRVFNATVPTIVENKCAAAVIEPKHAEKKSHVPDARRDKCFFCRCRCARPLDPEPNEQIRREANKLPEHEQQKQTVCNNDAQHCAREKREISEKPAEIFIAGHVASAEDKDAKSDECDHHQHNRRERIQNPSKAQRIFAKGEPSEILNHAEAGRVKRRQEREDRQCQRGDLADDRESDRCRTPQVVQR